MAFCEVTMVNPHDSPMLPALACSFARTESLIGRPQAWLRPSSLESAADKGPAQSSRRFMNNAG